jgi:sporulation protein YlmC with PRC-barrel domain
MTDQDVLEWRGAEVIDRDGDKVGTLEEIYFDEQTRKPEWALVKSGLFGQRSIFVPLIGATHEADHVRVRYDKDEIKDAPKVDPEGGLTQDQEEEVYRHYGLDYSREDSASGLPGEASEGLPEAGTGDRQAAAAGAADAGTGREREPGAAGEREGEPDTGDERESEQDETVPRVERQPVARLRLTKYVVTEHVPVQREEVHVEEERER